MSKRSTSKPAPARALNLRDHDILVRNKDGTVKDIAKHDTSAPRPHADGCVGCRRESVCVICKTHATLGIDRCVSGACASCCERFHKPHGEVYKLVTYAS